MNYQGCHNYANLMAEMVSGKEEIGYYLTTNYYVGITAVVFIVTSSHIYSTSTTLQLTSALSQCARSSTK